MLITTMFRTMLQNYVLCSNGIPIISVYRNVTISPRLKQVFPLSAARINDCAIRKRLMVLFCVWFCVPQPGKSDSGPDSLAGDP